MKEEMKEEMKKEEERKLEEVGKSIQNEKEGEQVRPPVDGVSEQAAVVVQQTSMPLPPKVEIVDKSPCCVIL